MSHKPHFAWAISLPEPSRLPWTLQSHCRPHRPRCQMPPRHHEPTWEVAITTNFSWGPKPSDKPTQIPVHSAPVVLQAQNPSG